VTTPHSIRDYGQARNQLLRFGGAKHIFGENDFCFYYMFKTNVPGHNTIWGTQKDLGSTAPEWSTLYE